jgi:hypothetical protein
MSFRAQGLARILSDAGTRHPISIPDLAHDIRLAIGQLRVRGADHATLKIGLVDSFDVEIGPPIRRAISEASDALWVVDVPVEDTKGTACAFAPHHQTCLKEDLPLRVPASLHDRLSEVKVRLGDDLSKLGSVHIADRTFAVLGLRTLAALSDEDAESITWWLPSGDALELRLVRDAAGAWLHLVDLLPFSDRSKAHSGPTALLELTQAAHVTLVPDEGGARGTLLASAALIPPRSDLMDAWVRYGAAELEEATSRQVLRALHPLEFREAQQQGKNWAVEVQLSSEAAVAWLGADHREGRKVRVSQPVAVVTDKVGGEKGFTLEGMTLRGPGIARAILSPPRGSSRLPESGKLEVRDDRGAATKRQRERQALESLSAGRAACGRLPLILRRPGEATTPELRTLARSTVETLDGDQLRAVLLILGCEDVVAIQGPPGTGKTRVIVEALRQIATRRAQGGAPLRVLVSSVQNEAVANVAERLAEAEGLLVRVVQRGARDEDESIDFAVRLNAEREVCIRRLRARLEGFDLQPRLDRLSDLGRQVDAVRVAVAASDAVTVERRLAEFIVNAGEDLSGLLREEGPILVTRLGAATGPQEVTEPKPEPTQPANPAGPAELERWWGSVAATLPAGRKADLGFQVSQVFDALRLAPGPRRDRRIEKTWADLVPYLETVGRDLCTEQSAPSTAAAAEVFGRVNAWCVRAHQELKAALEEISRKPQAIALRFLRSLEAETGAWQRIVESHGATVAATCSMSAKVILPPGEHYDWVIIDEAGRASPFELLVPMVQGARVVLIGDHRQLPPMVDQNIARRADDDKGVDLDQSTVFGELFRGLPPGCKCRLSTQYRMHGDIGAVVDAVFYRRHGENLDSWFSGTRAGERASRLCVLANRPLCWVDVAPGRQPCTERNEAEAQAIVELVRRYATAGAGDSHVAVIIPYAQQRELVSKMVGADPILSRVAQVKTIDAVQGREYPVVILGLTRTDSRPGFLASPNRVNVAISRAQQQLVVVGTRSRFLESPLVRSRAPHLVQLIGLLPLPGVMT